MNPSWPSQAPIAQSTITARQDLFRMMSNGEEEKLTEGVDGVEAEADGDEGRGVVERCLHRVHVSPGEGGGVVGLVVEAVNLQTEDNTT